MTQFSLDGLDKWIRKIGLIKILGTILTLLWGLLRSIRAEAGIETGHEPKILRSSLFYSLASVGYFGLCYRLWQPLPLTLSRPLRIFALFMGCFAISLAFSLYYGAG